jgi:DNA-binding protein H-NS
MAKSGSVDFSKFSIEELETLVEDAQAEIVARKQAERERVLGQMRELAASLGLTLQDVARIEKSSSGSGGPTAAAAPVQARYRHPDDPSLTWSGRGKRPTWLAQALESGKSLDDFAV